MTNNEKRLRRYRAQARSWGRTVLRHMQDNTIPGGHNLIKEDARWAFHYARLARQDGYFGEGRGPMDGPAPEATHEECERSIA